MKSENLELKQQLDQSVLTINQLREDLLILSKDSKNLEQSADSYQKKISSKTLEFDRLNRDFTELISYSNKLALKCFELKTIADTNRLVIRHFHVFSVSPVSNFLTPMQLSVVKYPDSGNVFLSVFDGVKETVRDIGALLDVCNDPKGTSHRFVVTFSHNNRILLESQERDLYDENLYFVSI